MKIYKIKTLELVTGLPGAGKTKLAQNIMDNCSHNIVHLDIDYFRKMLTGKWFDPKLEYYVNFMINKMIHALFNDNNNYILINDALWFINKQTRQKWIELAQENMWIINCVFLNTSMDQCLINNLRRKKQVADHIIIGMQNIMELPDSTEGFSNINIVSWEYLKNV